jgi:mRNA interferase MazF
MTPFKRGTVVLVPFPFTDLSALKRRPAVVISSDAYNATTGDVIIAQITSRVNSPPRPGDHLIRQWRQAGLAAPSLARARMTTLHASIVVKPLGAMPHQEMSAVNRALASALGLP